MNSVLVNIFQVVFVLGALLSLGLSALGFHGYFTYVTPTRDGNVTVSGVVDKYEKKRDGPDEYFDIYLKDNPVRFRIGIGSYEKFFKREVFFANIKAGSKLNIEVKQAALDNPIIPPKDPQKTVFIETLNDGANEYYDWDAFVKWSKSDILYALVVGIFFLGSTILMIYLSFSYLPNYQTRF